MKHKNGDFISHKYETPLLAQRLICVEQRSINLAILPKELCFEIKSYYKIRNNAREPFTRNVDVSFWERVILRKNVNDIQSIIRLFFNVHYFPKCNTIGSIYLFRVLWCEKYPLLLWETVQFPFRVTQTLYIILYITCAIVWRKTEKEKFLLIW